MIELTQAASINREKCRNLIDLLALRPSVPENIRHRAVGEWDESLAAYCEALRRRDLSELGFFGRARKCWRLIING